MVQQAEEFAVGVLGGAALGAMAYEMVDELELNQHIPFPGINCVNTIVAGALVGFLVLFVREIVREELQKPEFRETVA
ncbi:MAG: hypothetical protein OHK0029_10790 [Armatimonadaceae bacterium]